MFVKTVIAAVLAVVFGPVLRTLWNMDWNLHFHKHHPGKCRLIKQTGIGSEDLQILSSGLTFITSGLSAASHAPAFIAYAKSKGRGSIQMVELNDPNPEAKVVNIKHDKNFNPATFRPHGLSVLEDKVNGEHLLYVINHPGDEDDRVEKFRYAPKTKELQHIKSFFSDKLILTNDLTVVSEDNFFITNCIYSKYHKVALLEMLYQIPLGGVLHYNDTGMTRAVGGLFAPNGVIMSKDNRYVYVSLGNIKIVHVYKVEPDYKLKLVQEAQVHTGLDNFHLSEDGKSLYAGCHPIMHHLASHLTDPVENRAPSQVLRLPLKDGLIVENEITEEFYDHGDLIAASSTASVYKNRLLIGSVIDTLAICDLYTES